MVKGAQGSGTCAPFMLNIGIIIIWQTETFFYHPSEDRIVL